jgi:tRNA(fMet)-specific endonuclease VapC
VGLSLDTSVLIDVLRGDRRTLSAIDRLEGSGLVPVLSAVAVFEVLSGVEFTKSRSERARVELVLRQIPLESFDLDAARRAGELRAELQRAGSSPGAPDVMIAGHALAAGHTLVTRDRALATAGESLGLATATL